MQYDFGLGLDRRGTNCSKWDTTKEGVLPLYVADMDFPCAPEIVSAIQKRAAHPAYGYTFVSDDDKQAAQDYYQAKHGWAIDPESLLFTPGVVNTMMIVSQALTKPGERILLQPPVYGPFYRAAEVGGRIIVENKLKKGENGYEMDLDDLEKKLEGCKLMLLCSPHNPVGKVWEKPVLETVIRLCKEKGVTLLADEIHCDFVFPGHAHTPALTIPGAEKGVISAVSATKSFNIAGLDHSSLVIPDEDLRAQVQRQMTQMGYGGSNIFGITATTAAYRHGESWHKALMEQLTRNRDVAVQRFNAMGMPTASTEGTYLLWVDMRRFGLSSDEIRSMLMERAGVRLSSGTEFGPEGEGYMRVNLACPLERLEEALGRIEAIL